MVRRILTGLAVLAAVTALVYALGPRVPADTTIRFAASAIGDDPETYINASEAKVSGIREGLTKEIVWADPSRKAKTPLAIVYVHGFSASKGEVRPLPDLVAQALGANLFYTRLTGHGETSEAMGTATVNDWIDDYQEALAIGRMLGDKVVVVATSTGAALAVQAAAVDGASAGVAAIVMISPNFGIQASGSWLLTGPWGLQIAELLLGEERSFKVRNDMQERLWTSRYPTSALPPMAALVALAREAQVERIGIPALFIFSDADTVVRPDLTRQIAARWGAPHELVTVTETGDPDHHVIAGDALSPGTTKGLSDRTVTWLTAVLDGK